jgi:NHL repeat
MGQGSGHIVGTAAGARRGSGARGLGGRWLVAIAAAVTALMLCSSSAQGFIQRGHVFDERFGKEQGLSQPSAVAVDESSGDVYVLDSANNRVMVYGPEHQFLEAWGYGVKKVGSKEFERCKAAEECQPGTPGFGKGQFHSPVAIAVDNDSGSPSHGDVYVIANDSPTKAVVDEFAGEGVASPGEPGELIRRLITKKETAGGIEGEDEEFSEDPAVGLAVNNSGTVLVEREVEEERFALFLFGSGGRTNGLVGADEKYAELEVPEGFERGDRPVKPGFAVDANGDVYITYEPGGLDYEERQGIEEEIKEHERPESERPPGPCEALPCYVAELEIAGRGETATAVPVIEEFERENTTGVAVDLSSGAQSSGDVYLDNATSAAAFTATGTLLQGMLIQRFGSDEPPGEGLQGGRGIAVDANTDEVFVPEAAAGRVAVYTPEAKGAPTVGNVRAAAVTSTSAELRGQVDAEGLDTHYYFEYGTASCADNPCADAPAEPGTDIGEAFDEQPASVSLEGLSPETTYHFRLIATNINEHGEEQTAESGEKTFTTSQALPDNRGWELVSPANKDGVAVEGNSEEGNVVRAAADGEAVTYVATAPLCGEPAGNRAPEPAQILSRREGDGGWSCQDIATENRVANGFHGDARGEYQAFSPDLSLSLLEPEEQLGKPVEPRTLERTIYLRADAPIEPGEDEKALYDKAVEAETNPGYLTVISDVATEQLLGATSDLNHAIVRASDGELYEWSSSGLQLVSLVPPKVNAKGEPEPEKEAQTPVNLGKFDIYEGPRQAISEACSPARAAKGCSEGDRVVFYDVKEGNLYMRELKGEGPEELPETLQINTPNSGVSEVTQRLGRPLYQTANTEDTTVFFSDPQQLTVNALDLEHEEGEDTGTQLYAFESGKPQGERLTDVAPTINGKESPGVVGGVIGASEDGSYVYFVANGVLATNEARGEHAEHGGCGVETPRAETCNLYVSHYEGGQWNTTFIARLSNEDGPDWGGTVANGYSLFDMTSRVSPNGEYLAFMSDRPLTGYENTDVHSGERDEEVFLYKASSEHVVCASCDPSGAPPDGVHDVQEAGEGGGLLVDRPETWSSNSTGLFDNWLAANIPGWSGPGHREGFYQSRYLSNDGRLFFNSSDALVPQDHNAGTMDVYEYEPGGVGSCSTENTEEGCVALISSGSSKQESAFMEASENGEDAFFLTSAKLSPLDTDTAFDVYDAVVCPQTGCVTPPVPEEGSSCNGEEECSPGQYPQSTFEAPATAALTGSGNIAVLGRKEEQKPKPETKKTPTRAQKLAAALRSCRTKFKAKSKKPKREACERAARKKYGAKKASKAGRASARRGSRGRSAVRTRR